MSKSQILSAADARAAFPFIVGEVLGAEVFAPGHAIVRQDRTAWSVISGGVFAACCPSRDYAVRRLMLGMEVRS